MCVQKSTIRECGFRSDRSAAACGQPVESRDGSLKRLAYALTMADCEHMEREADLAGRILAAQAARSGRSRCRR